jgi:DNA replication protein DnaC
VVALTGEERHFDAREPACLMGRLDVRVLGPLEVVGEDGFVPLPQGKARATLGALLIHPNTVVTTDRLIDAVWGAHPPTTAHKSIHVYISQLRRSLGADTILTRPPGYELRLEPSELDLYRFERLRQEVAERAERRERRRLIDTRFPLVKRLEDFRFDDNPKIPTTTIAALADGGYLSDRESIILIGDSGTGKTHLATALGIRACSQGRRVRFTTLAALANELPEAESRRELNRVVARYARIELLILDELGYLALPDGAAELVFQVISERHERASLIITTNLPFGEWGRVFPDPRLAKAVVDRVTHRAHIIDCGTQSWRFTHGLKPSGARPESPVFGLFIGFRDFLCVSYFQRFYARAVPKRNHQRHDWGSSRLYSDRPMPRTVGSPPSNPAARTEGFSCHDHQSGAAQSRAGTPQSPPICETVPNRVPRAPQAWIRAPRARA